MRLFAAASTQAGKSVDTYTSFLAEAQYPWVLISYLFDPRCEWVGGLSWRPEMVLTDSGAYSVWKSGGRADIDAYLRYCKALAGQRVAPAVHISLDVIPGKWGRSPTPAERQAGMDDSLRNGDLMRREGLPVMEVYHQFEPLDFLHELIERLRPGDLLGLSPRQGIGNQRRIRFLDGIFHHLLARYGLGALPPIHGLGVGGRGLVYRYPWWSTDSMNWIHDPAIYANVLDRDGLPRKHRLRPENRSVVIRAERCIRFLHMYRRWSGDLSTVWERRGLGWTHQPQTSLRQSLAS